MKRLLFILALLLGIPQLYAQETPEPPSTADYYLQKSKKQYKTAFLTFGLGTTMIIGGAILFDSGYDWDDGQGKTLIGGLIILTGAVVDIASIPIFIKAGKNKRKSASLALNYKNKFLPSGFTAVSKGYITLSINLNL